MNRAARNSGCCKHVGADHDLFGCGVNLSTAERTYVRCHGLVEADSAPEATRMGALGRGVATPTSENARIVRGLFSSRTEIED